MNKLSMNLILKSVIGALAAVPGGASEETLRQALHPIMLRAAE